MTREAAADKIAELIEPLEKRVGVTFQITETVVEWLRCAAFESCVSQQSLVDEALEQLRAQRGGD